MPNVTVICFFVSIMSYGVGFSKAFVLKKAFTEHVSNYDYYIQVSLATGYFVVAIFFAVIGFLFFYVKNNRGQEIVEMTSSNSVENLAINRMIENI